MTIMVTSPTFSLNISNEQDVGSANLLSGGGGGGSGGSGPNNVGRRPSDSKRSSVYGNMSSTDDVRIYIQRRMTLTHSQTLYRALTHTFPTTHDLTFVS